VNELRSELMSVRRQNVHLEKTLDRVGLEKNTAGECGIFETLFIMIIIYVNAIVVVHSAIFSNSCFSSSMSILL
jgi:hypothetical protein